MEGSGLALSGKPSAHLGLIDNIIVIIGKRCWWCCYFDDMMWFSFNAINKSPNKYLKSEILPEVDLCKDKGRDEDVSKTRNRDEEDNRNLFKLPTTNLAWEELYNVELVSIKLSLYLSQQQSDLGVDLTFPVIPLSLPHYPFSYKTWLCWKSAANSGIKNSQIHNSMLVHNGRLPLLGWQG